MPLISDKDRYNKLSKDRGALKHSVDSSTKTTNHTLRESEKIVTAERKENFAKEQQSISSNIELGYHKDGTSNEVVYLFTLEKGESLINVMLCHYSTAGTNIYDLHWSYAAPEDLTFTVGADGRITAVSGGDTIRIIAGTLSSTETANLTGILGSVTNEKTDLGGNDPFMSVFRNVERRIYFYYVPSRAGTDVTYAKIKAS